MIKIGKVSVIMSTLLVPFKQNWRRKKKRLKRGKGKQKILENIKLLNRVRKSRLSLSFILVAM